MKISLVLFAIVLLTPAKTLELNTVLDIVSVTKDVVLWIAKAWQMVESDVDDFDIPPPVLRKTEKKLFARIDKINTALNELSGKVEAIGNNSTAIILRNLPERVKLELRLQDLTDALSTVEIKYKNFLQYVDNRERIEKATLQDFADVIVSHSSDGVGHTLEKIYLYIVPTGRGIVNTGVLAALSENLKEVEGDMLCNVQQSPQQVLYGLYNAIALTELKGYTMIQFSYMLKKLYGEGNFTVEAQLAKQDYYVRTNNIIKAVRTTMQSSSKDLWKCDPKSHKEGETYVQITKLLQGYIQNEVDLNPEGTCRENCGEYTYTKSHGCYKNLFCQRQKSCHGKIINCRYVDSDMWVCPAADPNGDRRYEYVEYENGRVLGRKQGCRRGTTKVDSWWRWLFWHCSYCLCLCDEQGPSSDRYINLRTVVANIKNNRVVTGLRFVKHNRIIHLQIQEGKLLPRGNIDNTTVQWVPVDDYKITDKRVYNGQDYHTLSWEKRAIDLDDLTTEEGSVVTGVRFKMIGSHLNFEIYVTPFDFETGRLIDPESKSVFKDNPNTDSSLKNPRTRVKLVNPDISTRSSTPSIPDSRTDQYLEFTNTDLDRDVGQTTVPFFDAQKVESLLPVPLSGAGIFHKGRNNFGGFVAPKIITYDFSKHLQTALPEQEPEVN